MHTHLSIYIDIYVCVHIYMCIDIYVYTPKMFGAAYGSIIEQLTAMREVKLYIYI